MSVLGRLEDAEVLLGAGREEGALLCVLTAISGTSRQRYPRGTPSQENAGREMGDREAFETFVRMEMANIGPNMNVMTSDGPRSWGFVLYRLFRCSLAHEAALPPEATFCADNVPGRILFRLDSLDPIAFTMSHTVVIMLADLVARARENVQQCAAIHNRIMSRLPGFVPADAG